ncbi:PcfJ domain-containing protein [Halobacteriovorax sp. DPLXC-1]|uniref:PcfJ domain-containing protein n=1 Tax=Halobacteriovorax sp. DPLXC-1 TaxID=3110771 RepID=UPI002FF0141D
MGLLLDHRQLIQVKNTLQSESLTFEKLLRRIFSGQFDIQRLRLKSPNSTFYVTGEDLLTIYQGYLKRELVLPKTLTIYKHYCRKDLHPRCGETVFLRPYHYKGMIIKPFSTTGSPIEEIIKNATLNSHQIAYNIFNHEFFSTTEFSDFEKKRQVYATPQKKEHIDKSLVNILKVAKMKDASCYVNVMHEINSLAYMASFEGAHGSCFMGMIVSSEERIIGYNELICEVNAAMPLGQIHPLIKEDKRLMHFCMQIYKSKPKALINRMAQLLSYPDIFSFLVEKSNYSVDSFQESLTHSISKDRLNFVSLYLNRYEFSSYLYRNDVSFHDLINDLFVFKKQIKMYGDVFFVTLKHVCEQYPSQRINPYLMYNVLASLIQSEEFKGRYRQLNSPLDLSAVETYDKIEVRELLTQFDLEQETKELGHCVGTHGYDHRIETGQSRILSLKVMGERSTVEIRKEFYKSDFEVIQHKGKSNCKPSKVSRRVAKKLVKQLSSAS